MGSRPHDLWVVGEEITLYLVHFLVCMENNLTNINST